MGQPVFIHFLEASTENESPSLVILFHGVEVITVGIKGWIYLGNRARYNVSGKDGWSVSFVNIRVEFSSLPRLRFLEEKIRGCVALLVPFSCLLLPSWGSQTGVKVMEFLFTYGIKLAIDHLKFYSFNF